MPKKYYRITTDKYNRRIICQYKISTGELLREWATATLISEEMGFDKNAILRCCKGIQKRAYWFLWRFKGDELPLVYIVFIEKYKQKNG